MIGLVKKQSKSTYITCGVLLLAIVAFILYGVNVGAAGYFKDSTSGTLVIASVFELIALAGIILLSQVKLKGFLASLLEIVIGLLKILACVLPLIALFAFIDTRIEGLAYIYFSNEEILATIQTPANLSSAATAIAGFIFYGVTALGAIVAAFFSPVKYD